MTDGRIIAEETKTKVREELIGNTEKYIDKGIEKSYKHGDANGYRRGVKEKETEYKAKFRELKDQTEEVYSILATENEEQIAEYENILEQKDKEIKGLKEIGQDLYKITTALIVKLKEYGEGLKKVEEIEPEIMPTTGDIKLHKVSKQLNKLMKKLQ